MLHGTRERFTYVECGGCGYLWLQDEPPDLGRYYPSSYYSFRPQSGLKAWLKAVRGAHAFGRRSLLSSLLTRVFGLPPVIGWLAGIPVDPSYRILDVGCGQGVALRDLSRAGFAALHGIEPFLATDLRFDGVEIRRQTIDAVEGTYDVVLLNHSFEHMPDQLHVLRQIERLLSDRGWAIIRMPITGRAWRAFGADCYSLDAPRHLAIHSVASFPMLVAKSGMTIVKDVHDTDEHYYLASRQYQADVALTASDSYMCNLKGSAFTKADVEEARRLAVESNRVHEGDQATYFLRKTGARQDGPQTERAGPT